ncbi:hypothetical protein HPB50_008241 [Hyalomma asiaticum]|uniref:Uncharacterized protein n=1 Tax=Hyalomma asiaticum TaxID=266040 RepID=A0ACB7T8U3_HYAAI|nr:hypothetical protein HPB50_008241 [Hyalomma asiaticum]
MQKADSREGYEEKEEEEASCCIGPLGRATWTYFLDLAPHYASEVTAEASRTRPTYLALPLRPRRQPSSGTMGKEAMRCYRCTLKGHRAYECRRRLVCTAYKGRHASTLCDLIEG